MNKKRRLLIFVILLILLLFGHRIYRSIHVRNVFDEIYYSRITSAEERHHKPFKPYHGNFRFMPQIKGHKRYSEIMDFEYNIFSEYYKDEYLDENAELCIDCYPKNNNHGRFMDIVYRYEYYDEEGEMLSSFAYWYTYYVDEKLLVYGSSDPENTEKKQFLFDIFLKDYFKALGFLTEYSMNNLGYFKFVDTTIEGYDEDGEIYQNSIREIVFQTLAVLILALFHACYFIKMLIQRKKGKFLLSLTACLLLLTQLFSIYLKTVGYPLWVRIVGILMGFLGVIVMIRSITAMGKKQKPEIFHMDKKELITIGIYQYSRNPVFLGFYLTYVGMLLLFFNWVLLLVTIFTITIFHCYVIRIKEPYLTSVFGDEYLTYRKAVDRYGFEEFLPPFQNGDRRICK